MLHLRIRLLYRLFQRLRSKQPRTPNGRYTDDRQKIINTARQLRAEFNRVNPNHTWRTEI